MYKLETETNFWNMLLKKFLGIITRYLFKPSHGRKLGLETKLSTLRTLESLIYCSNCVKPK